MVVDPRCLNGACNGPELALARHPPLGVCFGAYFGVYRGILLDPGTDQISTNMNKHHQKYSQIYTNIIVIDENNIKIWGTYTEQ